MSAKAARDGSHPLKRSEAPVVIARLIADSLNRGHVQSFGCEIIVRQVPETRDVRIVPDQRPYDRRPGMPEKGPVTWRLGNVES